MSDSVDAADRDVRRALIVFAAIIFGSLALIVAGVATGETTDGNAPGVRWESAELYPAGDGYRVVELHRAVDGFDVVCVERELGGHWGEEVAFDCVPGRGAAHLQREGAEP